MHSNYIPQSSRSTSRRHVQSSTPTRNRTKPSNLHRRMLSNPASLGAVRPVTPPDGRMYHQPASWTDSPRSLPYIHNPHAVPPEVVLGPSVRTGDTRSDVSDMPTDVATAADDMPMDEAEHNMQRVSPNILDSMRQQVEASRKEVERLTALLQKSSTRAVDAADRGGGVAAEPDDVSSLGEDDHTPKFNKLLQAIAQSRKPSNLTSEERALWDAYQSSLANVKAEASRERRDLEMKVLDSASQLNHVRVREKILQEQLEEARQELQSLQNEIKTQRGHQEKNTEAQQRQKAEQAMKVRRLEDQLADLEFKYKEAQEIDEMQQEEHERAICAIQRVLADVTTEREMAIEELQAKLDKAMGAATEVAPATEGGLSPSLKAQAQRAFQLDHEMDSLKTMLQTAENDRDALQQDLDLKVANIVILEKELKAVKDRLQKTEVKMEDLTKILEEKSKIVVVLEGELASAKHQVEILTKHEEEMTADADEKKKEIHKLRRMQRHMRIGESESHTASKSDVPSGDVASLRKELEQTQASLENAKKIITSLESANVSLAQDLRSKLKDKEETVQMLQKEAVGRTRDLDSLATELRDLQRRKNEMDRLDLWSRNLIRRQQILALQLETALNDLQSAAVVFEATMESGTADSDVIDNVSKIMANALGAVKYACMDGNDLEKLELTASYAKYDTEVDGMVSNRLRQEVEERKIQINRLEESLKQHKEELAALRRESTQARLKHEEEKTKQRTEILMLRDQCKTNLEVLAKKERELEVLRDSLDVGDGTGYISDDASSDGGDEMGLEPPMSPGGYSHSQTEALATLMANGSMDATANSVEIEKLHKELKKAALEKEKAAKELKTQRESLANAKMIISSLERANKSMMEDLRQRLQESNTAIASLLDKSTQSEKQATSLKAELERLKREKEDEAAAHKKELQKLKDQAIAQALQLAAKDREIQELRRNVSLEEPAEESKQE